MEPGNEGARWRTFANCGLRSKDLKMQPEDQELSQRAVELNGC